MKLRTGQLMRYSLVLCLTIILHSMPQAAKAEKPSSAAERHAVEQAMRDYARALRAGTPDEVAACYTADGELLLPGLDPIHGRDAIRAFLAPLAAATEVESVD